MATRRANSIWAKCELVTSWPGRFAKPPIPPIINPSGGIAGSVAFLGVPMGIRFLCPSGHKLNVKTFLAGKRAICPECGAKVIVPEASEPLPGPTPSFIAGATASPLSGPAALGTPPLLDTASQTVVLSMAESAASLESYDEVELDLVDAGLPESVGLAPPPIIVADMAATEAKQELQRARNRHTQFVIAIVLLVLVIVLAMILIWVLHRNATRQDTEPVSEPEKTSIRAPLNPGCVAVVLDRVLEGTQRT